MDKSPRATLHRPATLLVLCLGLWLTALFLFAFAVWLIIQPGGALWAGLALGVAILCTTAGIGLFQMRRWGVILFGLVGAAGSVNHISNTIQRFVVEYNRDTASAIASIISVLGAFLIPFALIYLVLILWRKAH